MGRQWRVHLGHQQLRVCCALLRFAAQMQVPPELIWRAWKLGHSALGRKHLDCTGAAELQGLLADSLSSRLSKQSTRRRGRALDLAHDGRAAAPGVSGAAGAAAHAGGPGRAHALPEEVLRQLQARHLQVCRMHDLAAAQHPITSRQSRSPHPPQAKSIQWNMRSWLNGLALLHLHR